MRNKNRYKIINKPLIASAAALAVSVPASADDIDIYSTNSALNMKPNILFVLDYSGSMTEDINGANVGANSPDSKISILKEAVNALIDDNTGSVNIGLGSLYGSDSTGVKWPVSDLSAPANTFDPAIPADVTVADVVKSQLSSVRVDGYTATVNGLAEAAAYFRGDPVLHNDENVLRPEKHEPAQWDITKNRYDGGESEAAIPASYDPPTAYQYDFSGDNDSYSNCTDYEGVDGDKGCEGKITFDCDYNAGYTHNFGAREATEAHDAREAYTREIPAHTDCKYYHPDKWTTPNYVSPIANQCQANFIVLISDGQPTQLNDNTALKNILADAGIAGGDRDNCEDLSTTIFNGTDDPVTAGNCGPEILDYLAKTDLDPDIKDSNVRTYTVGFSLDDEDPGKKYLELLAEKGKGDFFEANKPAELSTALNDVISSILSDSQSFAALSIDIDPATLSHDNRTYLSMFAPSSSAAWKGNLKGYFLDKTGLIDINGNAATVEVEGELTFAETAQSFWSETVDGSNTIAGGASETLTNMDPAPNTRNLFTFLDGPGSTKTYIVAGGDITDAHLGNPGDALGTEALNWLANAPMGDPLHTKPVSVNYSPDLKVVFSMTNQGVLHAFNASLPIAPAATPDITGGEELFAFMPKELLLNISDLYKPSSHIGHIYGLDGAITRWHNDLNNDGYVDAGDGETLQLIFGMRRGGNSYYAIDVTNPTNPEFAWQISGDDPAYAKLAQTWSRPSLVNVNDGGTTKTMLMFGGGYDAAALDGTTKATAANGNTIFLVDPDKIDNPVWTIAHPDMDFAIPSDLTIIDTDRNGTVDRAYVGDLGGQVWRLDFEDINDVSVNLFADLQRNPNDYQPIFYAPSVASNRDMGTRFYSVSVGTGDRTQPMIDDSENAVFMLKDLDVATGEPDASTFSEIGTGDIYLATDNDIGALSKAVSDAAKLELATKRGWKVELQPGEKALSKLVTFEGKLLATTFEPSPHAASAANLCVATTTIGRIHIMNVIDGQPMIINEDGSDSIVGPGRPDNRLKEKMSIPPSPAIAYLPKPQIIVGKEVLGETKNDVQTVFWHAK